MSALAEWSTAAFDGPIAVGEVHVWLAMLDRLGRRPSSSVLSPDEQDRAARFVFARDRQRFVAAHVLLRRLLAPHLHTTPGEVRFSADRNGKPTLSGYAHAPSFNLSHSQDAMVLAISRGGEVGIDIEAVRALPEAEKIAARFFAPGEIEALRSLALDERERAFFTCWTRKEAFVKAVGGGLRQALDSFEVTLRPGEPARLVHHAAGIGFEAGRWTLSELPAVAGYVGALAVKGAPRAIHYRAWSDSDCREEDVS
jgi:4'-phosphopantetheinyl transferase